MEKISENKGKWIDQGYALFSQIGPDALNVEKLSHLVGLSRSSFYYYFGDLHQFEEVLLSKHVENYVRFGELMKDYTDFKQLFSEEIMVHKEVLAFQRQLLIHKSLERYQKCSEEARVHTEAKTYDLWTKYKKVDKDSDEEWALFKAIRDFYYIQFDQSEQDPQDVLVLLHSYLTHKK
ncbi:TetR/AcrR family transcriptional regulator [Reichenbachiella ulvae]|uniref:TetR/AcrR family transcriptional regulator n=1 Tax=Reichenbachiella ulvae TaxID=2980104 RepID=A0ABT3CY24_9BACT|nr:TetR/AcrR family transcriptional regulator [Reichenbachiella ulvae]MCV9388448.1 TetR/AcrR family transcriptional regulator [Reichenbachiella ulvae]